MPKVAKSGPFLINIFRYKISFNDCPQEFWLPFQSYVNRWKVGIYFDRDFPF